MSLCVHVGVCTQVSMLVNELSFDGLCAVVGKGDFSPLSVSDLLCDV